MDQKETLATLLIATKDVGEAAATITKELEELARMTKTGPLGHKMDKAAKSALHLRSALSMMQLTIETALSIGPEKGGTPQ